MRLVNKEFVHQSNRYSITYLMRRENAAKALEKWLIEGKKAGDIDLKAKSYGSRDVRMLEGGYVVKETKKAMHEFEITSRAEDLTVITPAAGAAIVHKDSEWGALTVEFIRGAVPVFLLKSESMLQNDIERVRNGVLYAMGSMHYGDGHSSLLHLDPHMGNILVLANPEIFHNSGSPLRAEIRVVDLEKSKIVRFGKRMMETMAYDLLVAINQLMYTNLLPASDVPKTLDHYLESNHRIAREDLKRLIIEWIPKHKKLVGVQQALPFIDSDL